MKSNITKEIATLERMTVDQLRDKYADVFGEETRGRHKQWLIKRIAWRLQALEEGDLSERARQRAAELANDADLRVTAPRKLARSADSAGRTKTLPCDLSCDSRLPMPGTILTRQYKGRSIQVKVLQTGFEFEGEIYKSLSAVSKAITGSHWNGYHFFGLRKKEIAK